VQATAGKIKWNDKYSNKEMIVEDVSS